MSSDEYIHPADTHFENSESSKSFALGGKIMLSAIVVLICVVFFMVGLHLYARWYLIRARRRQLVRRRNRLAEARRASQFVFYVDDNPATVIADPGNMGLDSSVLRSLPVFVYSAKTRPEPLDCAVCLSEFEDGEKGRLLPKCNHVFHIDCIDMWFNSHSTCPLCRSPVEPVTEPETSGSGLNQVESAGPSSHHHHEEGNSSTTSLGSRRKGFDVRIEVPNRNELDDELTLSSPASGAYKSPGARLFSQSMKRILSMGGRKTPTGESSTTPSGAAASCTAELDLEQGPSESPPSRTPR